MKHFLRRYLDNTNLSWRLSFGIGKYLIQFDWWYDRSSRRRHWMPLEARVYGTRHHHERVAQHAAQVTEERLAHCVEMLRNIGINAYFFQLDNTEMHPAHRRLFGYIVDACKAALISVGETPEGVWTEKIVSDGEEESA